MVNRLPPSERLVNYAKVGSIVVTIILSILGYVNRQEIAEFGATTLAEFAGIELAEADGVTEIDPTVQRWNDVAKFSEESKKRMDAFEQELQSLNDKIDIESSQRNLQDTNLQDQIDAWHPE